MIHRHLGSLFAAILLTAGRLSAHDDTQPPLIVSLVGDSTVAAYQPGSGIRGWGEYLVPRLRSRVVLHNDAVPGASSSSFFQEGHWSAALRNQPQVVLIQFGHNDFLRHLDPVTFRLNLRRFIDGARAQGATVILVTPVQLRAFDGPTFTPSLVPYADAIRAVAAEAGTPLVDLHRLSGELFTRLGPARAEQLGSPEHDKTHFNALGSQALANIVLRELSTLATPLRREIREAAPPAPVSPAKARRR